MENQYVNEIVGTMATSMHNSQLNATNTEKLVQQVQDLSGKSMHEKTIQTILDAPNLEMEQKMSYIHQENAEYDGRENNNTERVIKLQETQTQNVGKVISWCCENWYWLAIGTIGFTAFGTSGGRKALSCAVKRITA